MGPLPVAATGSHDRSTHHLRLSQKARQTSLLVGLALATLAILLALFGPVIIRTGSLGGEGSSAVGCYRSGTSGDLVKDALSGVAIIEPGGRRVAVTWPPGWSGRRSGFEVEIATARGEDDSFLTCGGRTTT